MSPPKNIAWILKNPAQFYYKIYHKIPHSNPPSPYLQRNIKKPFYG
jgi:hypothetical protein